MLIKKFTNFIKKLFSIFLIFNLTCVSTAKAAAVHVNSFDLSDRITRPSGIAFNNNGTKMFVSESDGTNDISEYSLTTGFDVSTASFVHSFDISSEETTAESVRFNNDGTKMFILGRNGDDVYEYTLTTGFDVSTANFVDSFDVSPEEEDGMGLAFNTDGTKMFVTGFDGDDINEYTLTTGFDVSTAKFKYTFEPTTALSNPREMTFNNNGTKMFIYDSDRYVKEYTLTVGFDVSTASFLDKIILTEQAFPYGLVFNDDGTKLYITGLTTSSVNEYTLSCAFKVTSSSTCDDPSTIKEVVASIEAQVETVKRFAKKSSGSVLKRLAFLRSHQKDLGYFQLKDGSLRGFIGNSQDIDVNFSNKTLDQLINLAPIEIPRALIS